MTACCGSLHGPLLLLLQPALGQRPASSILRRYERGAGSAHLENGVLILENSARAYRVTRARFGFAPLAARRNGCPFWLSFDEAGDDTASKEGHRQSKRSLF